MTAVPAPHSALALDVSGTAPIPFHRLVLVELRKSYDTLAGFWLLVAIGVIVTLGELALMLVTLFQDLTVAFVDFVAVAAFLGSFLLPVLGIMLVTQEWGQRTAMVSFALEPRRLQVVLAKLAVGMVLTLATAAAALVVGAVLTTVCDIIQPELTSWDFELTGLVAFVIGQMLTMTGGFALAALFLNTPLAIVVFFVYKWVLPLVLAVAGALISQLAEVGPWINFSEALYPLIEWQLDTGEEWAQLLVSGALWIGFPLGVGLWRILHAEVK